MLVCFEVFIAIETAVQPTTGTREAQRRAARPLQLRLRTWTRPGFWIHACVEVYTVSVHTLDGGGG